MYPFRLYLIAVFSIIISASVFSQVMIPEKPPSFKYQDIRNDIETVDFIKPDFTQILIEDAENEAMGFPDPPRMGVSIPVNLDIDNSGTWTELPDGSKIWRLRIVYPDALAIGINFEKFFIPEGGKVFFYNADHTMISGAFTDESNTPLGAFSSDFIQGDIMYIEYWMPADFGLTPSLSISEVIYAYKDIWFNFQRDEERGGAWSCMINVACEEGDGWEDQSKGVTRISIKVGNNYFWCSGSLINNTNNDRSPYILTAGHCGDGASTNDHLHWRFYFNYEASWCGGNAGSSNEFRTGCTLKALDPSAGDDGSDFRLVLINQAIPSSYEVYFNGWNRTNSPAADTSVSIHHPAGDIKKVSTYYDMSSSAWWNGLISHWKVYWAVTLHGNNTVQGGSSGGPIFDEEGYILGDLTGGFQSNSCSNPSPAWYGKIWYSWDQNGTTSSRRLKDWLDPDNTGVEKHPGLHQAIMPPIADFSADTTNITQFDTVYFTDETTGNPGLSWVWIFEGGTPDTSYEKNPMVIYTGYGDLDVSLTVTNADGTDTEVKNDYITVEQVIPPIADFEADTTHITEGEEVSFTDLSTSNPETWMWIMEGADPDTSYEQNPSDVEYPTPGNYDVTLIAANLGGADTLIRMDYILVDPGQVPVTDFVADVTQIMVGDTVNFTDLSSGNPTRWTWSFEGADPPNGSSQNPEGIVYHQEGSYNVQLRAQNGFGNNTMLKEDYILVGAVTVKELNESLGVKVYPNPSPGTVNIRFASANEKMEIRIFNGMGVLVNTISVDQKVDNIRIDMSDLPPAIYTLRIDNGNTITTRKVSLINR